MFLNYNYSVHFAILPSEPIINLCGPDRFGPWGSTEEIKKERDKKAKQQLGKRNNKDKFYTKLERHICRYGIKNPIIVNSGFVATGYRKLLPEEMNNDDIINDLVFCDRHGGSRLYIAKKLRSPIPCLINCFNGKFKKYEELHTIKEIKNKFIDAPEKIIHNEDGIHVVNVPQIHMEQGYGESNIKNNRRR